MPLFLSVAGCLAIGAIAGATSIGGFLLVPLLTLVLGVSTHEAVGTALVAFVPGSVLGTWLYSRRGHVDLSLGVVLAALSLPGIFLGTELARRISSAQAVLSLSTLLILIGLYIVWQMKRSGGQASGRAWRCAGPVRIVSLVGAATLAGVSSVLAGVGGALILVPVLVSLGVQPQMTVGTGQLLSALISLAGAWSHVATGHLNGALVAVVTTLYSAGVLLGAVFSRHLNAYLLRVLVAGSCFASAVLLVAFLV